MQNGCFFFFFGFEEGRVGWASANRLQPGHVLKDLLEAKPVCRTYTQ